jgi:hypothetical protein
VPPGSSARAAAQAARCRASSQVQVAGAGHADAGRRRPSPVRPGIGRLNGSARSAPARSRRSTAQASDDRGGEDRHAIEAAAGRHHAARRHRAEEGFRPTIPFSAAGTRPDPAVSVPSASATMPRATATAEPGGRPARHPRPAPNGVARHGIGRADADQAGGELVEIGLADQDGTGGAQPGDRLRVALGDIGEIGAGGGHRPAGDVDVVLHRDRQPQSG